MVLVLGIGNWPLSGDGARPAVIDRLSSDPHLRARITYRDSGTVGLALLPEIEASDAFIAVDAAEPGAPAGTVQVLLDEKMDAHLCGRKKTVYGVALADLLGAAMLAGTLPSRRALLAIQPETLDWGLSPSQAVIDAVLAASLVSLFASVLFPILASPDAALNQTCDIALSFSFVPMFASRVYGGC